MTKRFQNFHEVNEYLKQYYLVKRYRYALDNMNALMEYLGNPQDKFKAVHVAGTSGKTSTAHFITSLLNQAGQSTGMTASPHVDNINERVQINMIPLPESEFCDRFGKFVDLVEESGVTSTYFEILMAFAFYIFAEKKVDYGVIEVGVGGLLDGTNVMNRTDKVAVITDISLDHTNLLGKTLEEVAQNKAGIILEGNSVFCSKQSNEVLEVIREVSATKNADLNIIDVDTNNASDLPMFQQRNWQLAKAVFDHVSLRNKLPKLDSDAIIRARQVYIPARMETVEIGDKILIMDGAHNDQKLDALLKSLSKKYKSQKMSALFALVDGKDNRPLKASSAMRKFSGHIILTSFNTEQDMPRRSIDPDKIAENLSNEDFHDYEVERNPQAALSKLLERPEEILLVTGSFYLLNHIRPFVLKNKKNL